MFIRFKLLTLTWFCLKNIHIFQKSDDELDLVWVLFSRLIYLLCPDFNANQLMIMKTYSNTSKYDCVMKF